MNCGMVDHVATQCGETPVSDDFAYSRWAGTDSAGVAAHTVNSEDDRELLLHPPEHPVL